MTPKRDEFLAHKINEVPVSVLASKGRACRNLRAAVIAEEVVCGICGREVDKESHHLDPTAPQVDHVVLVSIAPKLAMVRSNLRLVQRRCNRRRGVGRRVTPAAAATRRAGFRPVFGPLSQPQYRAGLAGQADPGRDHNVSDDEGARPVLPCPVGPATTETDPAATSATTSTRHTASGHRTNDGDADVGVFDVEHGPARRC